MKINYNRLFGKYYTRYFNNKDKVLPVLADVDYCKENNLGYIQWNGNYYMAPENSGYVIILNKNNRFNNYINNYNNSYDTTDINNDDVDNMNSITYNDNYNYISNDDDSNIGIPKCVKVVRKYKNKKSILYSNISYKLDKDTRGLLPSTLFMSYGYELSNLFRCYFDFAEESIEFEMCHKCKTYIKIPSQLNIIKIVEDNFDYFISPNLSESRETFYLNHYKNNYYNKYHKYKFNILGFSVNNGMDVFPYAVINHVYNFDSSLPFVIIMLNTTKLYTIPNYRYEYITSSNSKLFNVTDKCVQAIFSLYRKFKISIIDNSLVKSSIYQFTIDENLTILIADKIISKKNDSNGNDDPNTFNNTFLWHSLYINIIPDIPIIDSNNFINTLPSFDDLRNLIKNITAYHYYEKNEREIFIYGVWSNDIYYPCKLTTKSEIIEIPNKPYFLLPRNINGEIYDTSNNHSSIVIL